MFTTFVTHLVAVLATIVSTAQTQPAADADYANQTPYGNAASSTIRQPPEGYRLRFVETVGRHGSRTLTSSARERRSLAIWQRARKAGALTPTGRRLATDIEAFQVPERRIGYGNLSAIGTAEWQGIGRRTAEVYGSFLTEATAAGDQVVFTTSPVQRTVESADAMREGLESVVPGLTVPDYVTDGPRLLIGNGASSAGNRATQEVLTRPSVVAAATRVLERLYSAAFVREIDDPVAAALDLYLLYSTAPGMAADTRVTFRRYVPLADAKVLAEAVDGENFYQFGPGVAGEVSSYRAARPLLDDFFTSLDERLAGGSTAAVFRLAHGETTMPFAALMKLPGSEVQASSTFSYATNPWRGSVAGRLGGSVEWAAYQDDSGQALVTVRYDEQPVELSSRCTPTVRYFYRPAELKRCLG
ncbi:histidine-type phosphatase [Aeromicrobium fastidiosum]|uniref:Multiple inositol polyphosphate phosphatase 1 n=1 Tax=Aeromicrobium fastidiosum TaxID=52699 RepID=A0A641AJP9_9ACTN|nr:histidine-type phosphatase [Aeromicrobium fastidiosum]KAA1376057.1 histidine-type phosphatase [Aeromicrobium fastidiosum]MBP2392072.1 hypothetical protein [Aeromicrobium fastidiosum]